MKPCVIVVTGSVEGCGRRNPEPMNRSYRGPKMLSKSCACKKGGKGGARISSCESAVGTLEVNSSATDPCSAA